MQVARGIAGFDLGQTVVIAGGACVAVEAMEGTDATIARAARWSEKWKIRLVRKRRCSPAADRGEGRQTQSGHAFRRSRGGRADDCGNARCEGHLACAWRQAGRCSLTAQRWLRSRMRLELPSLPNRPAGPDGCAGGADISVTNGKPQRVRCCGG